MARKRPTIHSDRDWHLDKRVPIALIVTLVFQFAGAVWWARGVSSDIAQIKTDIYSLQTDAKDRALRLDRLTIVETRLEALTETGKRLEKSLDRLLERRDAATPAARR